MSEIQVVLVESIQSAFKAWLESRNCRLFEIPSGPDDLPTYGIAPRSLR